MAFILVKPYPMNSYICFSFLWLSPFAFAPFVASAGECGNAALPNVHVMNPRHVLEVRQRALDPDYMFAQELKELYKAGDDLIAAGTLYSVTFNAELPNSGDKHDYFSLSPYWWPDPDSPDGLPYIRRDGEVNPERDIVSDRLPFESMMFNVDTLARAYYFSADEKYAQFATQLIRTWFLNPETKMNPNMRYGQMRRGIDDGQGGDIICTRWFYYFLDSVELLRDSEAWTDQDHSALKAWMAGYLDWLTYHPFGRNESVADNNHGTSYEVQLMVISLFLGRDTVTPLIAEHSIKQRIDNQIEADGRMPLELVRTKAWNYSIENLRYLMYAGIMARPFGIDLFHYNPPSGGTLKDALDYLVPYVNDPENWPDMQITQWEPFRLRKYLFIGQAIYQDPKYDEAMKKAGWTQPLLEDYLYLPDVP
jgi:hypothetical protein